MTPGTRGEGLGSRGEGLGSRVRRWWRPSGDDARSIARWSAVALGVLAVAALLVNREYRENFLTGPGIAQGALIAAIALGVLLTYRGSGVVNLANGAVAMYVGYVYTVLRRDGDLFLPPLPNPLSLLEGIVHGVQDRDTFRLPDIPTSISFGTEMGFWPAAAISLAFCVALGLTLHVFVFRPLRHAPPLAKVVASVGLFLTLQAVVVRRFGITPRAVRPLPFVDKTQIDLRLFTLSEEQLFVAILVVAIAGALFVLFQRTRFGLATRAAAENEKGAVVLGYSPDFLAGTNWVLSSVITGMLGIFVASINSTIEPVVIPALIVPALTAALVGGFSSFARTTAAAFVLGMQLPLVQYLGVNKGWFPRLEGDVPFPGVDRLLPLLGIVLVLFLAGRSLPTRGAITAGRLPFSPTPPRWAIRVGGPALAVAAAGLGLFVFGPEYRDALSNTLVGIVICLSVVVITGFVGQISLAQMAFAGMSAFIVSKLSTAGATYNLFPFRVRLAGVEIDNPRVHLPELPFPWPIFVGAAFALVVGLLVALPALRVRGVNLAIVTFAFAVAVDDMVFKNSSVSGTYKGAPVDVPDWVNPNNPSRRFLGLDVGDGKLPNPSTAIFCLVAVVVLCALVANLRRSTTGRQMLAMRSNERAAAAAGVNVAGTKLLAFAISAFIAGIGGAVIAYRSGNATADKFEYTKSLVFFAFAYLGGISSVAGAIAGGSLVAGGLVFTFLERSLAVPSEFTLLLGGLGLIVAAVQNPEGIAGRLARDARRLADRLRPRARPAPTAPAGAAAPSEAAP